MDEINDLEKPKKILPKSSSLLVESSWRDQKVEIVLVLGIVQPVPLARKHAKIARSIVPCVLCGHADWAKRWITTASLVRWILIQLFLLPLIQIEDHVWRDLDLRLRLLLLPGIDSSHIFQLNLLFLARWIYGSNGRRPIKPVSSL